MHDWISQSTDYHVNEREKKNKRLLGLTDCRRSWALCICNVYRSCCVVAAACIIRMYIKSSLSVEFNACDHCALGQSLHFSSNAFPMHTLFHILRLFHFFKCFHAHVGIEYWPKNKADRFLNSNSNNKEH